MPRGGTVAWVVRVPRGVAWVPRGVAWVPGVWCGCLECGAVAWGWQGDERLPDVVCGAGVVSLRQGFGVTASAFYGATPHKKIQLGSPKGLPSRSFFSEKTEAGA